MNYLTVTLDFALWWYSGGLKKLYLWLAALFGWLNNFFSVKRVVFTMFEPWKRVVSEKRPGLEGFRDFLIDNFISRLVGFVMRVLILMVYLVSILLLTIFAIMAFAFWTLWPFIIVFSFFKIFI
jgi:hypothetical protein